MPQKGSSSMLQAPVAAKAKKPGGSPRQRAGPWSRRKPRSKNTHQTCRSCVDGVPKRNLPSVLEKAPISGYLYKEPVSLGTVCRCSFSARVGAGHRREAEAGSEETDRGGAWLSTPLVLHAMMPCVGCWLGLIIPPESKPQGDGYLSNLSRQLSTTTGSKAQLFYGSVFVLDSDGACRPTGKASGGRRKRGAVGHTGYSFQLALGSNGWLQGTPEHVWFPLIFLWRAP